MFKIIDKTTGKELTKEEVEDLAKRDGFACLSYFFKWFDKKYDLKTPKKFWVYRFKREGKR